MNNSYEIDPNISLVKIKITGFYNSSEFKRLYNDILNHPQYKPGSKILFDASELDFTRMSSADVNELVKLDKDLIEKRGKGKTTFVVSSDVGFGMLRMFELHRLHNHDHPIMIFRGLNEAEKWIKE